MLIKRVIIETYVTWDLNWINDNLRLGPVVRELLITGITLGIGGINPKR